MNSRTLTETTEDYLSKYNSMKQQLYLPLKLRLYFTTLQEALQNPIPPSKQKTSFQIISLQFYSIFSKLQKIQKAAFLYSNLKRVKDQYDELQNTKKNIMSSIQQNISTSAQISETNFGFTTWTSIQFVFSYKNKQIKLDWKKKSIVYDLRVYLVRKSQKYKNTLVLEAITDIVAKDEKKISICFRSNVFPEVYSQILNCILGYRNQQLIKMEMNEKQNSSKAEISLITKSTKSLQFLNAITINQYLTFKNKIYFRISSGNLNFQQIFRQDKISVQKSINYPQLYRLESIFDCTSSILSQQFHKKYKDESYSFIIQSQNLQTFSQKYTVKYQKYLTQSTKGTSIISENIMIEDINQQKNSEQILFLKNMKNQFIDFICVKIKQQGKSKSKLIVYGQFNTSKKNNRERSVFNNLMKWVTNKKIKIGYEENQMALTLLLEYSTMLFRQDEAQQLSQLFVGLTFQGKKKKETSLKLINSCKQVDSQFQTVSGKITNFSKQEVVQEIEEDIQIKKLHSSMQNQSWIQSQKKNNLQILTHEMSSLIPNQYHEQQQNYLTHKYQLAPSLVQENKQLMKQHFIFGQWSRKEKGGLVCKNEKSISQQKNVIKYLLKSIGRNILESKGLMNISLPVTIFSSQSHLQSVARNFSFAPIFLEKGVKMKPQQKIKIATLFALSVCISSISVKKPFNPILGQTHQVWIDGCPMYLQQISHHPPIVAYYFIGRGYKLYGKIGPKATFGFNVIYGYSQESNTIIFDDGTQIFVNFGKMSIKGIIFGERQFNFEEQMFAFDVKNKLFSTLRFHEKRQSIFKSYKQPNDYIHGEIVEVGEDFMKKFVQNSKVFYPTSDDILRTASMFKGIWNGCIKFDDQLYIDFAKENPCVVSKEQYLLPSDSTFRQDIIDLIDGNIQASQSNKQILEEIQRRDRRLRAKG